LQIVESSQLIDGAVVFVDDILARLLPTSRLT